MSSNIRLGWLNSLPPGDAIQELKKCCGARRWAEQLVKDRPFETIEALCERADSVWWSLGPTDWLEAFLAHPRIGENKAATPGSEQTQKWSGQEQAAVRDAAQETVAALAELNKEYDAKFGHIFIVCASGKSSEEMLAILHQRLNNDAGKELQIAAGEQAKITKLRIRKLLE